MNIREAKNALSNLGTDIFHLTYLFSKDNDKTINNLLWSLVSKIRQIEDSLEEKDGK